MQKNVASQKAIFFAFDATTNLPKTGDAANLTGYVSKDYGSVTVLGDTSATEMDATNAKGYYLFDLTQGETNADTLLFSAKSSTANISVIGVPATVFTTPPNFSLQSIDSNGRVDVIKIAGTTQTARDIGASVLLSAGTGTGQLDITAGVVKANVTQLLGTAWLTPGTAGTPDVNVKLWNGLTAVALPLVPTTAGRTLDVSAGGEAGVDWANVGSPTTTVDLSGTTIAITQKVDLNTIKTQTVTAAAGVTFPASIASPTNITAGTLTTVVNLTNAPTAGDFTSTMKTSIGTAVAASAVASVTGNVGGNVVGSVGSISGITFPANFSSLVISASGRVDVGAIIGTSLGGSTGTNFNAFFDSGGLSNAGWTLGAMFTDLAGISSSTDIAETVATYLFTFDTTLAFGDAVAGSVVKETADNAGGSSLTVGAIADEVETRTLLANVIEILGTAVTEGGAGRLATAFTTFLDVATPVFTAASVNQTGDSFARLGAPAGASVSADIAAVKTDTAAIKTKTDFLPSVTAGSAGGVFIAGSNAATTVNITGNITGNLSGSVGSVTGSIGSISGITFPTNFSSLAITATTGRVTAGTVLDKTGYSLTQAFPANFDVLGIGADGHILDVDSYTGDTPQTGDAFARLGAPAGASVSADIAAVAAKTSLLTFNGSNHILGDLREIGGATTVYGATITQVFKLLVGFVAGEKANLNTGDITGVELNSPDGSETMITFDQDSFGNVTNVTFVFA